MRGDSFSGADAGRGRETDGVRTGLITACVACLLALAAPAGAGAATNPLGLTDCGPAQDAYSCGGLVPTWDGVPLDTTVTLPSESAAGPLPLVVSELERGTTAGGSSSLMS